jgi:hypothetical protein
MSRLGRLWTYSHEAHRPLHISELMRLLADQGVSLPGGGAQANFITYLRRDERFVRPARGMYALAEWDSPRNLRRLFVGDAAVSDLAREHEGN